MFKISKCPEKVANALKKAVAALAKVKGWSTRVKVGGVLFALCVVMVIACCCSKSDTWQQYEVLAAGGFFLTGLIILSLSESLMKIIWAVLVGIGLDLCISVVISLAAYRIGIDLWRSYLSSGVLLVLVGLFILIYWRRACKSGAGVTEIVSDEVMGLIKHGKSKEDMILESLDKIDKRLDGIDKKLSKGAKGWELSLVGICVGLMVAGSTVLMDAASEQQRITGVILAVTGLMPFVILGMVAIFTPLSGRVRKTSKMRKGKESQLK